MPTDPVSYGFGTGTSDFGLSPSPAQPPTRSAPAKPVALTMEQYVSPSVIGKETKASRPRGADVQLQREAGPPLPSATPMEVEVPAGGKGRKKKKKKGGKSAPPQPGPANPPKERREPELPQPSKGGQGSGKRTGVAPLPREERRRRPSSPKPLRRPPSREVANG